MFGKIKSYLLYNANQNNEDSISFKLRKKRFDFFVKFCDELQKPVRILDLGGSDYYWRNLNFENNKNYHITILNIEKQNTNDFSNLCFIKRDARDLSFFDDKEYDLVHSNSLLEHINNFEEQKKLADEIDRIGEHYFIQTPDYYFPFEPHFLFPFFQFLPENLKVKLLTRHSLGWFEKQDDKNKARDLINSIRLLKKSELKKIFPGAKIYTERFFGINKSFIVYN